MFEKEKAFHKHYVRSVFKNQVVQNFENLHFETQVKLSFAIF